MILLNNLLLVLWMIVWPTLNYFALGFVIQKLVVVEGVSGDDIGTVIVMFIIASGIVYAFVAKHICSTTKNIIYVATHKN